MFKAKCKGIIHWISFTRKHIMWPGVVDPTAESFTWYVEDLCSYLMTNNLYTKDSDRY